MRSSRNILCPKCKKNKALVHPTYGIIWCKECSENSVSYAKTKKLVVPPGYKSKESYKKWLKKKAEITRTEKTWHEDIKSRQVLPDGRIAIVKEGKIKEIRDY